ncbi:MAG: 1-acyl-sn-glycerol-3-phosphate acyltransferase, partial [Deltaproteobacteria bacterium]|nr:1-acyl-sn-glycerol-3-phosphate acyltransferase [Deltaproteobacteria bacterium]
KPFFTVMAKQDFLSGNYLSTNFFKGNAFFRSIFKVLDKTGLPKAIFNKLNLISIPRPFADKLEKKGDELKKEITDQFSQFKSKISEGFSTLIFPEGTTWGFGGLKKIRSSVYQLVSNAFEQYDKKIYILPINVKVDRLVKGWKDVFINVGKPQFVIKSKDDFNQYIFDTLQKLHTITFSQVGAYYLKRISELSQQAKVEARLTRENLITQLENAIHEIHSRVQEKVLPAIDSKLIDSTYLKKKTNRFIRYCLKKKYILKESRKNAQKTYIVNLNKVLAQYPEKIFRKQNPIGFHANELISLGEQAIEPIFSESVLADRFA